MEELGKLLTNSFVEKVLIVILALIVIFGVLAIVVAVVFNKSVLDIVITVYGALGLNGIGAALKGVKDAPIQQQQALNQTAQFAKTNDISIPIAPGLASNNTAAATPTGLQVWTPNTSATQNT